MPTFLAIAAGLVLLVAGGDLLVRGSARVATHYGVSPLVVGLTVVAFGTSAPELAVCLAAVRADAADLAVGNVLGSNIFNVLVILGLSALLVPLSVSRRVVWVEVPIVIAVSALALVCARDGRLGMGDGLILLLVVAAYTGWLFRTRAAQPAADDAANVSRPPGVLMPVLTAIGGLGLLVLGARWLVNGSVALASALGINDVVIGLTIVAGGTSLPEAATSVVAALRGQRDMAIGNVLGSNIFNLTVILGTSAVAANGLNVPEGVVTFDFVVMVAVAVACLPIFFTGHTIARWEGGLFLAYYIAYTTYLVLDATAHERLPHFRDAMAFFALPLTAVTLLILAARAAVPRQSVTSTR